MISNLEFEFNRLSKVNQKILKNTNLEFDLTKKVIDVEETINFERMKTIELQKVSRAYDKEITRLLNIQEIGTASKNSVILRDFLQTKEFIGDTEKLLDK